MCRFSNAKCLADEKVPTYAPVTKPIGPFVLEIRKPDRLVSLKANPTEDSPDAELLLEDLMLQLVECGDIPGLRYALENRWFLPDHRLVCGSTLLHVAAFRGDLDSVSLLLEHGADVNHVGHEGLTPLEYAAAAGHYDCARRLIQTGADISHIKNGIVQQPTGHFF